MTAQFEDKDDYVDQIRSDSAYPTFRLLVKIVVALLYLAGFLTILGSMAVAILGGAGGAAGPQSLAAAVVGTATGVVQIVLGKFFGEASVMLADIADSTLEFNSRRRSAPKERREEWSL